VQVAYYLTPSGANPVRRYLDSLPDAEAGQIDAVLDYIRRYGLDAFVDHRQVKGKLWELRPNQQRVFYVVRKGPEMVLLHAYKKQGRKAPKADVRLALKRLREVTDD
jgi:phage-related protein